MEIKLKKKLVNPIVIEGFPGFGLVGTIATEFLMEHLCTELVGRFWFDDLPATIAIHGGKVINPVGVSYCKKHNLLIVHSISGASGIEWKAADLVLGIAKEVKAREIISLEGVGSPGETDKTNIFYYTNNKKSQEKLDKLKIESLKEGIIMGVTSALMVKSDMPTTCLFAETHSALPDSKAAAKIIETLDKYLGLKVDYKPLLEQAEKFEEKLKGLLQKSQMAAAEQEKKQLSYVG
jgi:uncharacterized protein